MTDLRCDRCHDLFVLPADWSDVQVVHSGQHDHQLRRDCRHQFEALDDTRRVCVQCGDRSEDADVA